MARTAPAEAVRVVAATDLGPAGARPIAGLQAGFTAEGATVAAAPGAHGAAWRFQATPVGFGCDGALAPVGRALPVKRAGRTEYARPELREWYTDTPRGIEQGFTLPAPPACRGGRGGDVVIALGGGLGAVVSAGGRAARLHDAAGHPVLRYTDLHVIDASGRELPARLEARGEALAIHFDDTHARYPVEVDPMMGLEQAELNGPVGTLGFGSTAAVSGDTLLVGTLSPTVPTSPVSIFVRSGASWTHQQDIAEPSATRFGRAVAVDGDTAVVVGVFGQLLEDVAFVYTRSGSVWTEQQELMLSSSSFSEAVAISGDTVVVGQPGSMPPSAQVFSRTGTTWALQQALESSLPDGGPPAAFGTAVAISGDTVLVGAPGDVSSNGVVYVFTRTGSTWSLQQQLVASDATPNDAFGTGVAVQTDMAAVAALGASPPTGAAYLFTRVGGTWTEHQVITPTTPNFTVGPSIALSASTLAIGQAFKNPIGEVSLYALGAVTASLEQTLASPAPAPGDGFGTVIALDGSTLAVTAPGQGNNAGAVFVFGMGDPAGTACTTGSDCFSGYCTDGVCCGLPACPSAGDCNAAETCQPVTGTCSATPINEGMPCSQGDLCNGASVCQDGACNGTAVVCSPADDCHEFGSCDPATGTCSTPAKADGQPCAKGVCMAGACVPSTTGVGGAGGGSSTDGAGGSVMVSGSGCKCEVGVGSGGGSGGGSPPALAAAVGLAWWARRGRRRAGLAGRIEH